MRVLARSLSQNVQEAKERERGREGRREKEDGRS